MYLKISYLFSLALLLLNAAPVQAKIQKFKLKEGSFSSEVPAGWKSMEDVLGVPVTLTSDLGANAQRAVILITPYGITDKDDVFKKIPKDPEVYAKQKEDWLQAVDGESLSYDNYREESINGLTIYSIGVTYEIPSGKFHQQTFYISDQNKHLYMVNALTPLDLNERTVDIIKTVTRSIASVK